jgi:hypothetical protein
VDDAAVTCLEYKRKIVATLLRVTEGFCRKAASTS